LEVVHDLHVPHDGVESIAEMGADGSLFHLFKADRDHAFGDAAFDRLTGKHQRRRPRGTVVVDVVDRDPREPDAIHHSLTARALPEHVPGVSLLHFVVRNPCVFESGARSVGTHHVVLVARTRLGERNHSDAENVDSSIHVRFS